MKPVILAALVLLLACQNEALKCYCGGNKQCSSPIETCYGSDSVCASVIFTGPVPSFFKGCSTARNCAIMNEPGISSATCCRSDLCNR